MPKKNRVHFKETFFVVGFIFGALRETTEFYINSLGSFLGKHPIYIHIFFLREREKERGGRGAERKIVQKTCFSWATP